MPEHAVLEAKDRVTEIVRHLLEKQGLDAAVGPDDDLADRGLSSSDLVNLMLTVEDEFGIAIPERAMRPAHFRSIASIDALVQSVRKTA